LHPQVKSSHGQLDKQVFPAPRRQAGAAVGGRTGRSFWRLLALLRPPGSSARLSQRRGHRDFEFEADGDAINLTPGRW